jgi:hypothetical protein
VYRDFVPFLFNEILLIKKKAFGSILGKIGGVLLGMCMLRWGMGPRPGSGLIFGVGRVVLRMVFRNYTA